jgi:tetratricopeptide (TPR) repeat protein
MLDAQGLPITASSPEAAAAYDATIAAYCRFRRDTGDHLKRALAADPRCPLALVLRGYFMQLFATRAAGERAAAAATAARGAIAAVGASPRERRHLAALESWLDGDLVGATAHWRAIVAEHPRDLLAMKLGQYGAFYLGDGGAMRAATGAALAGFAEDVPGYGFVLGCHAFSLEEEGDYEAADRLGREAVRREPADVWAAHAVAHVAEMEDRPADGLAWIGAHEGTWSEVNNFVFHLRWHAALFELALGFADAALVRYDRAVRAESTDDYLDIANAVSLLLRFEQRGLAVGRRWDELAARARAHLDDHRLVFADLHYVAALAAAGDDESLARWFRSAASLAAEGRGDAAHVLATCGLAIANAILAHRKGEWRRVVECLVPVRGALRRIGGSHAQRDLFEEMLIDAALKARLGDARGLIAARLARRPGNRWARDAASVAA